MTTCEVINPATEELLRTVELTATAGVDDAVARAQSAQRKWARLAPAERARALRDFAAVVDAHVEELAALEVANSGDRPVQVGSHYHFAETNPALDFDREAARGMRLDIAAGTAVRFEPGQSRDVILVPYAGRREVWGFNQKVMGPL